MLTRTKVLPRGKALEEAFFFRMDQELIELLSKQLEREEKIKSFTSATGIRNRKRLEALVDSGFELSTLTAFIWVPLVFVAWADGIADENEKHAIVDVLAQKGISPTTASSMMDHDWFRRSPKEELWNIWEEFASATFANLNPSVRNELMDEIIGLCHVVADASGGFLGLGKVSTEEAAVIDRIVEVLHRCASKPIEVEVGTPESRSPELAMNS